MMTSKRFTALILCFTMVLVALFANGSGDSLAYEDEITIDYITIENGKVVGGNEKLLESGLIVIGRPDGVADTSVSSQEDVSASQESVDSSIADVSVVPDVETETKTTTKEESVKDNSAVLGEQSKENASASLPSEAPTAVNPDTPRPTIKATLSGVQSGLTCNTAATYDYTIPTILAFKGPIKVSGGANVIIRGNGNDSTNGFDGIYRQYSGNLIEVNGGTLTIQGKGSGNDRFIIDGVDGPVGTNTNYPSLTTSYDNGGGGTLIYLISGTVNLTNVQMRRNYNNANNGGGIYVAGGTLNVTGTLSCYGLITNGNGGFIYASGGTINYSAGGYIYQNSAKNGGGLAITGSAKATFGATDFFIGGDNGNTVSEYGGGIYVNGGTVSVTNTVIKNNKANGGSGKGWGGGIAVLSGSATIGSGVTMTGNNALVDGGALFAKGSDNPSKPGTVNVTGGTISGNSASQGGGAYASYGGIINISGGTIESNSNAGVFLYAGGNLTMSGGTIRANSPSSYKGGGVCIYANGTGKFTMTGGTIRDHTATNAHGVSQTGSGGTIEIAGGTITNNTPSGSNGGGINCSSGTLTVSSGTISNNRGNYGGGIRCGDSCTSVTISGGNITGNTASEKGGGVALGGNLNASISGNANIQGNTATNRGGGVMVNMESGTLTVSGGKIDGNSTTSATSAYGGGMVIESNCKVIIKDTAEIINNTAVWDGGGIMMTAGELEISGGFIGKSGAPNKSKNGAGVAITAGTVTLSDNANVSYNEGTQYGAGFYMYGSGTVFTATGGTVCYNKASFEGGGFWVTNVGTFDVDGLTVNNNTANKGGGMYFKGQTTNAINLSNCVIGYNTSSDVGGGLYFGNHEGVTNSATSSTVTANLTGLTVQHNTAAARGGGLYAARDSFSGTVKSGTVILTIDGCTFDQNHATNDAGGGLYFNALDQVEMKNSNVTNNTANANIGSGGGICIEANGGAGKLLISGKNLISGNSSGDYGGGIIARIQANLDIIGTADNYTTITGNKLVVAGKGGAGVHVSVGSLFRMQYGVISDNDANYGGVSNRGGGVDITSGSAELENVTVIGNMAGNHGGGVSVLANSETSASLTMTNCTVGTKESPNTAGGNGGGVYISKTNTAYTTTASITGGNVSYNVSTGGNGGGIFVKDLYSATDNPFTLSGTTVTGNSASFSNATSADNVEYVYDNGNGGGLYIYNTKTKIENCTIGASGASNSATNGGGVAILRCADVTVENTAVDYNTATLCGGGFYVMGTEYGGTNLPTKLIIGGGSVSGNSGATLTSYPSPSTVGGGGFYLRGLTDREDREVSVSIDGTTVNDNSSNYGNGGAFYVHECSNVVFKNCDRVNGNYAGSNGGVMFYTHQKSSADIDNCSFKNNSSRYTGGTFYVTKTGFDVDNATIENSQTTGVSWGSQGSSGNGGAMYIMNNQQYNPETGANDYPDISFDFSNVSFTGCEAYYSGGAIFVATPGSSFKTVTITLNNCTFIGNSALANGGAIAVCAKGYVIMNGGYVVGNHAGNVSTVFEGTPYQKENNQVMGVGGGAAVFGGSYRLNVSSNAGAIYGNLAAVAGDDVFSNGVSSASVNLPSVSAMTLMANPPENLPMELPASLSGLDWYEDYMTGDVSYANGLNGNSNFVFRYRETPLSVHAPVSKINSEDYVSITVGVYKNHTGMITITASAEAGDGQRFVYTVTGTPLDGNPFTLTVSLSAGESVTISNLSPGNYTVLQQTPWVWRYTLDGITHTGGESHVISGDTVHFYLACTEADDTVSVSFANSIEYNKWLSHNSPIASNKASSAVAAVSFFAQIPKKAFVI